MKAASEFCKVFKAITSSCIGFLDENSTILSQVKFYCDIRLAFVKKDHQLVYRYKRHFLSLLMSPKSFFPVYVNDSDIYTLLSKSRSKFGTLQAFFFTTFL